MPSLVRGRPSASTNPAAGSRSAPPSRSLPAYELPSQPLSKSAQRSLATLASANNEKLKKHLKSASEVLGEVTDNINVIATLTRQRAERARSRRINEGAAGHEDADADPENGDTGMGAAEELGEKVDGLTVEIEGKLRKLIDAQARLDGRVGGLKEVVGQIERNNAESGGEAGRGTQSTLGASQFRGRRTRGVEEEEEEEQENDEDSGAHAGRQDQSSVGGGPGVPVLLKQKMEEWEKSYNAMSMGDRYASHNDYVHFRQSLHYATHAGSDPMPPVPHASTWFRSTSDDNVTQGSQEQPCLYQRASAPAEDGGDSGSDIEAVAASINIKCPVTLLPMKNPVTSTKCPHSFEKEAIEEMIRHSPTTTGGSGRRGTNDGVKALKCPVCSVLLTTADLAPDPVLRRNIQRIQAAELAKNNHDEDEDEDDGSRHSSNRRNRRKAAHTITSSPYRGRQSSALSQIKGEKARSSVVPSTQLGEGAGRGDEDLDEMDGDEEDGDEY